MTDYSRQDDMLRFAQLSPDEQAASDAYERGDGNRQELAAAITSERDPSKRSILMQEYGRLFRGESPPIDDTPVKPARNEAPGMSVSDFEAKYGPLPRTSTAVAPDAPKSKDGNLGRGFKVAMGQTVPLAKGAVGLVGATAENALGEGGISTAVKNWGLKGYTEGMKALEPLQHDNDNLTVAWDKAQKGDLGALFDWASYGLGYGAGQMAQAAATGIAGGLVGTAVGGPAGTVAGAAEGVLSGGALRATAQRFIAPMVAKEIARIAETDAGKALAAEEVKRLAVANVAKSIGQGVALTGYAGVQEAGSIYPEAEKQAAEKGQKLGGADLARIWATTAGAAALEGLSDKLGLDAVTGKVRVPGAGGRVARAVTGGAIGAGVEAGTEGAQTFLERVGAGQSLDDPEAMADYINSAGLGAIGGGPVGAIGGAIHAAPKPIERTVGEATADADAQAKAAMDKLKAVPAGPDPIGQMIDGASQLATRPSDDVKMIEGKARAQAQIDRIGDADYTKAEQARLEKLQEAVDTHAAMLEKQNATTPPIEAPGGMSSTLQPWQQGAERPLTRTVTQGDTTNVDDQISGDLGAGSMSRPAAVIPDTNTTELQKGRYTGPLREAATDAARQEAGLATAAESRTSLPAPVNKPAATQGQVAFDPNNRPLNERFAKPQATVTDAEGSRSVTGLSDARSQPITASSPDKYTGSVRFADLTPRTREDAQRVLKQKQALLEDPNTIEVVPHPGAPGKYAIKNTAAPFKPTETTGTKVDQSTPIADPVAGYVAEKRATNTPAARAFIQAYDAGRISREDVLRAAAADAKKRTDAQAFTEAAGLVAPEAPMKERGESTTRVHEVGQSFAPMTPIGPDMGKTPTGKHVTDGRFVDPDAPKPEPTPEPKPDGKQPTGDVAVPEGFGEKTKVAKNSTALRKAVNAHDTAGVAKALQQSNHPIIKRIGEQLSRLAAHTTITSDYKFSGGTMGVYLPGRDAIAIHEKHKGSEWVVAHESVHALTAHAIMHPTAEQKPIVQQIAKLRDFVVKRMGKDAKKFYGTNPGRNFTHEFLAEAFTNPEFQKRLAAIAYDNKSAWTKFTEMVAKLLGFEKQSTALSEIISLGDKLIESGRSAQGMAIKTDTVLASNASQDGEKLSVTDGAQKGQNVTYAPAEADQRYADALAERLGKRADAPVVLKAVGPATAEQRAAKTLAARLFGKPVVFVQFGSKPLFNGAQLGNTLYVNVDGTKPIMAVLGHELLHSLRHSQRTLYNNLLDALRNNLHGVGRYADVINEKRTRAGLDAITDADEMTEELLADVAGDNFMDADFWKLVSDGQPKGFMKVVDAVMQWLDTTIAKVTKFRPFGTDMYLSDLKSARENIAQAFREYSASEVGAVDNIGDAKLSVAEPATKVVGDVTSEQKRALVAVFGEKPAAQTVKERALSTKKGVLDWVKNKLIQGLFDQFDAIKRLDPKAYLLARMSAGSDGTFESTMVYGKPFINADGVADVKIGGGGFVDVLAKLQGEAPRFMQWVVGLRAGELRAQGRENLISPEDEAALKTLAEGKLPDGGDRTAAYQEALTKLTEYNSAILDIHVKSGLMSKSLADMLRDHPYIPFYRELEDGTTVPKYSTGLTGQEAFKKLTGGTSVLHGNLLENVLSNWGHGLAAAAKNRAALATIDAATQMPGIVEQAEVRAKGTVRVMRDGHEEFYYINDPHLLEAISAVHYAMPQFMKPLATFKRALTVGVTSLPGFKVKNLIRDSVQSLALADLSGNPFKNVAQGMRTADFVGAMQNLAKTAAGKTPKSFAPQNQTYASMLASGGIMKFGASEGKRSVHVEKMIRRAAGKGVLLDAKGARKLMQHIGDTLQAYHELGDVSEQANRIALYEQLIKKGYSHAEASFMARDLLDFSMSGKWPVVRFLTQTVPFLNARLQGLYKLGRAAKDDPKRFGYVAGAVALGSLALYAAYKDDEDFKKREDWDRDSYWWFKIGDTAFRVPKPFEIGSMGTIVERSAELMLDEKFTGRHFMSELGDVIMNNFALNPTPQAVKPIVELWANKDFFTGRSIEAQGMENLQKGDRYNERTSSLAKGMSAVERALVPDAWSGLQLSPAQVDHLLQGYLGGVAALITGAVDLPTKGSDPTADRMKFFTSSMVAGLPTDQSKYVQALYDRARDVDQAYASYQHALKMGDREKALELMQENREAILQHKSVDAAKRQLGEVSQAIQRVQASSLSDESKASLLTSLRARRNAIAERVETALPGY